MIKKILEILTTLTAESQNAALEKCTELGFDTNRGIITLDESFMNLNNARQILTDAIEKRKLIQLPITVQKNLLSDLESISRSITNLLNGVDEVVNLANYIEQLNVAIWQYGFHNLSDEVLGYLNKINQLKTQEVEIAKMKRELKSTIAQKHTLEKLLSEANQSVDNLKTMVSQSNESAQKTKENLDATTKTSQNAAALLANIQQNDSTASQLLASTKTSNATVTTLEPRIKEFYSQVDKYKTKMDETSKQSQGIIDTNIKATSELITKLQELEDQIKAQIQKATGFSLFHSFQTRQHELAKSKKLWIGALIVLVFASLCVSIFVITTTENFNVAFYVKLSMSLPLFYAIAFCTIQYGRERKLEEEYAFKSNISISLVPYKELVEKLVNDQQAGEREKFTSFIIDAVTKVYTSPVDKVFESEHKPKDDPVDILKQLEKILEAIVKPLEPLVKLLKH
jgi:predicted component of type VI protein secretion system